MESEDYSNMDSIYIEVDIEVDIVVDIEAGIAVDIVIENNKTSIYIIF